MVSFFPFNFTHTQLGLIFSFAFHSLLSFTDKSSISWIPRGTVTTFILLQTYCTSVRVCVVTPFPHLYSSLPLYSLSEVSVLDPEVFLGSRTKPHLPFHWLEQSTAKTAAGFGPSRLQGEWLDRTGKSRWSSLASVFCRYACVCACMWRGSH